MIRRRPDAVNVLLPQAWCLKPTLDARDTPEAAGQRLGGAWAAPVRWSGAPDGGGGKWGPAGDAGQGAGGLQKMKSVTDSEGCPGCRPT